MRTPDLPLTGTLIRMSTGPPPLRVTIAEEIRALMGRRRMSAVRLGAAIGRSQSYMSRRMTGEIPFDVDDLDAICAALDVPITRLIGVDATRQYSDIALAA